MWSRLIGVGKLPSASLLGTFPWASTVMAEVESDAERTSDSESPKYHESDESGDYSDELRHETAITCAFMCLQSMLPTESDKRLSAVVALLIEPEADLVRATALNRLRQLEELTFGGRLEKELVHERAVRDALQRLQALLPVNEEQHDDMLHNRIMEWRARKKQNPLSIDERVYDEVLQRLKPMCKARISEECMVCYLDDEIT